MDIESRRGSYRYRLEISFNHNSGLHLIMAGFIKESIITMTPAQQYVHKLIWPVLGISLLVLVIISYILIPS